MLYGKSKPLEGDTVFIRALASLKLVCLDGKCFAAAADRELIHSNDGVHYIFFIVMDDHATV